MKSIPVLTLPAVLLLSACTGLPEGIDPVSGLEKERYLGTWYEIARLDHSFEEGLSRVTADYRLNDDGTIEVVNRGYDSEDGEWSKVEGRARFADDDRTGHLEVSFFGPFYSSYVIFELDTEAYQFAYVSGYNRDYLWFLSRTPEVTENELERFRNRAREEGFDLDDLIIVDHSPLPQ
ncbi:lipocalin family protein [Marinobacter sp. F4216]|uniref:lipocalin family protein n=1 Tax=Marinobacter sp. F4216 TaxID=2874281 RepID=UPI002958C7EC|nr:lipocalin family protein [Marinobacter sp. F4216]